MRPLQYSNRTSTFKFLLIIFVFIQSCRKFVTIPPAPNLIITQAVFESDKTALAAASSVFAQLRISQQLFSNGGLSLYGGLASDELIATAPNTTTEPYFLNDLRPSTTTISSLFYTQSYKLIYQSNAVLEGLKKAINISDSTRRQLSGEMFVVRALSYFYLSQLFGDVPLVLTTDFETNAVLARTDVNIVTQQIITDLLQAKTLLSANYPSPGKLRPNQFTASGLLARVYLYNSEWSLAEREATSVIQSGAYSLHNTSSLSQAFLKNSRETIWEVASPNEANVTIEAQSFIPSSASVIPTYRLSSSLINRFAVNDQRLALWIGKNSVSGTDYYYPYKYKQRVLSSGTPTEYLIYLRLPELLLIRAEARIEMGQLTGIESAASDLNLVRQRAGLPAITTTSVTSLRSLVSEERQSEFFAEWGHRWLDLKRTGQINTILSLTKPSTWKPTAELWPIPDTEIRYNPFLTQNPGY